MDEVKHAVRAVKNEFKKDARGTDRMDTNDYVGNTGDEIGKDLGNLGDDIRKAGRQPESPLGEPDPTPESTM